MKPPIVPAKPVRVVPEDALRRAWVALSGLSIMTSWVMPS
jgi:hypothetical protein